MTAKAEQIQHETAHRPEPLRVVVGHTDTALGQEALRIAKHAREPIVEPDPVTDELGRESESVIVVGLLVIAHSANGAAT